jgi:hypothetical protein
MSIKQAPVPKSAIRREIFGERPLAPLQYPPVVFKPRTPWYVIAWHAVGFVCALILLDVVAGWIFQR